MKFKNFKNKLIAILIMSVAFVVGMQAQVCKKAYSNTDLQNIGCILMNDTLKTKIVSGGGGSSLRQGTLDSINLTLLESFALQEDISSFTNETRGKLDSIYNHPKPLALILTYTVISSAATNTISAGARKIDIANSGGASAQVNGVTFPAGATISFTYPQATLPQVTYNCLTSTLMISILR